MEFWTAIGIGVALGAWMIWQDVRIWKLGRDADAQAKTAVGEARRLSGMEAFVPALAARVAALEEEACDRGSFHVTGSGTATECIARMAAASKKSPAKPKAKARR